MCPACLTTAAVVVVSTTSVGGLVALAAKKLGVDRRATTPEDRPESEEQRYGES